MIKLGLNIDHVATLRQVRGTRYPNVIKAALIGEAAGADVITLHLREDRRHIQDKDVEILRDMLQTRMNIESAITDEMLAIALRIKPHDVCFVPERREELTTEGGLDVVGNFDSVKHACECCAAAGIRVSLFVDADEKSVAREIKRLEKLMLECAKNLEFEKAAAARDDLFRLKERIFGAAANDRDGDETT